MKKTLRSRKAKTRSLTFLLLRDVFKTPEDALRNPGRLDKRPIDPALGLSGGIYLAPAIEREPRWFDFLKEGISGSLPPFKSGLPSGVLFIQARSRLFAVTFGQGRYLLKSDSFELDFGLKVTLNTADPAKLRSLDLRTFEEMTVHTRRQVSRGAALDAFNVDVYRDLLRAFTGEPSNPDLGKRFTGKDALVLTGPISFADLPRKCARLLESFESRSYQVKFPWVDHIQPIRDATQVRELDDQMLALLRTRRVEKAHLAPPDMIEWEGVSGFYYPGERGVDMHPDLDLEECLDALIAHEGVAQDAFAPTIEDLRKRFKIRVVYDEDGRPPERWSVYDCLVLEFAGTDALHVLSGGRWFRIKKGFAADVEAKVARLARNVPRLPLAQPHQIEGDYNRAAAQASLAFALLDEQLIKCTGARSMIEACDLFSDERQFIHVKRKTRSSTLSHLFSQGLVSAEAFLRDPGFREALKVQVQKAQPALASLLGDPASKPTPGMFEIVFAVITGSSRAGGQWPLSLPFFSLLNLSMAAERLELLGFRVGIFRIDEQRQRLRGAA